MMKKILLSLVLGLGCVTLLNSNSYVDVKANEEDDEVIEYVHIPVKMEPYSVIEFVDESHFVILQGGLADDENQYSRVGMPKPKEGLIVTYANDGFVLDIVDPHDDGTLYDNVEEDVLGVSPYAVVMPGYTTIASWGAHGNTLYESNTSLSMIGIGRATTFSDTIGNHSNTLKKGDVALKQSYDNCNNNGVVRVSTKNSSGAQTSVTMYKNDVGGMPDAIVDIWKTGVEHWGYTWSSSFSMPDTVQISYTGNKTLK